MWKSMGRMTSHILWKMKHVWNHQSVMKQWTSNQLSIKPGISPPSHLSVRGPLDALLGTGSRWLSKPQHSWGCHKIFKNSLKLEPQWLLRQGSNHPKDPKGINKNLTSKGVHLGTSFQPWWQPWWPHISPPCPELGKNPRWPAKSMSFWLSLSCLDHRFLNQLDKFYVILRDAVMHHAVASMVGLWFAYIPRHPWIILDSPLNHALAPPAGRYQSANVTANEAKGFAASDCQASK